MKTKVLITLDQEAKDNLIDRAVANGMTLSGYINLLGHAHKLYHTLKEPKEENNEQKNISKQ